LEIDESALTGETEPARKSVGAVGVVAGTGEGLSLGERSCIGYMGTLVRNGELLRRDK
jgi:Ca2+-transporting ATPase